MGKHVDRYYYDVRTANIVDRERDDRDSVIAKVWDLAIAEKLVKFLNSELAMWLLKFLSSEFLSSEDKKA